jgi:hypothetical protein
MLLTMMIDFDDLLSNDVVRNKGKFNNHMLMLVDLHNVFHDFMRASSTPQLTTCLVVDVDNLLNDTK